MGSSLGGSNPSLGANEYRFWLDLAKQACAVQEPLARFELATSSLPMRCYTPKPQWRISADLHDDYNASSNISTKQIAVYEENYPQRLIIDFTKIKPRKATSLDGIRWEKV